MFKFSIKDLFANASEEQTTSPQAAAIFSTLVGNIESALNAQGYRASAWIDPATRNTGGMEVSRGETKTRYKLCCEKEFRTRCVSDSVKIKIAPLGTPFFLMGVDDTVFAKPLLACTDTHPSYLEETMSSTVQKFMRYVQEDMATLEKMKIFANSTLYP